MTQNFNDLRKANVWRSGTFWYDHVTPDQRELVRTLIHTADLSNTHSMNPALVLTQPQVDVWRQEIKFDPFTQLSLLLDPSTRVPVPGGVMETLPIPRVLEPDLAVHMILDGPIPEYWTENNELLVVPYTTDKTRWAELNYTPYSYLIKHTGIKPVIIAQGTSYLFAGIDFQNTEYGTWFMEDPVLLFPNNLIHVVHGKGPGTTVFPYPSTVDPSVTAGHLITRYLRTSQSPVDLEAALNELLGLDGFDQSCTILERFTATDGTLYRTDKGLYKIRQPHSVLEPGDSIARSYVPGAIVKLYCHTTHGDAWISRIEIPGNGIPAVGLLYGAVETDRLQPGNLPWTNEGGHVKFSLGTSWLSGEMFNQIREMTDELGDQSFSEYVIANSVGQRFPLLAFLLQNVWMYTGLAIQINAARTLPSDLSRIKDFLYRNAPLNSVLLYI